MTTFDQLVGQEKAIARLRLIASATGRMQNVIILSPAGMGKSTFVEAFAKEARARLFRINASSVEDIGISLNQALRPAIMNKDRAILFFDECHSLKKKVQTALLTGLEKPYIINTPIKFGRKTKTYKVQIPEHVSFCLATTDFGKMNKALITRMMKIQLDDYTQADKEEIARRYLHSKDFEIEPDALSGFARISRNIRQLILEVLDTAIIYNNPIININIFQKVCDHLQLTSNGLTKLDTKLLNRLADHDYVSLRNLVAYLGIESEQYDRMEQWLVAQDFIEISTHGRAVTAAGLREIGRARKPNVMDIIGALVDDDEED
jgi:Holliday junction resolvasome RuvABC ATP-dependent DNA helicase subunit